MDHQGLAPVDLMLAADPEHAVPLLVDRARRHTETHPRATASANEVAPRRRPAHRRASRPRAARGRRRQARLAHASPALMERRVVAVPSSPRLPRLRRRRRGRRRPRRHGRRGARAQGNRPHSDRHLRRRRFPDGRDRALDSGALPHSAADRGREQSLLLQRRSAPGARRAHAQQARREQVDRPAHQRSRHRPRGARARAGRARLRARSKTWTELGPTFAKAIAAVEQGQVAVVDVRVAPGYTPAMTAAVSNAERKA